MDATGSLPRQLLSVDDKPEHVERARLPGLQAVTWCLADGTDTFLDLLVATGSGRTGRRERLPP